MVLIEKAPSVASSERSRVSATSRREQTNSLGLFQDKAEEDKRAAEDRELTLKRRVRELEAELEIANLQFTHLNEDLGELDSASMIGEVSPDVIQDKALDTIRHTIKSASRLVLSKLSQPGSRHHNLPHQLHPEPRVKFRGEAASDVPVFAPDQWIFDGQAAGRELRTLNSTRPPRTELPKFDEDPRRWPMFIQSCKVLVHETCTNDAERLTHLRNCLTEDIRSAIGEALLNPGLYQYALHELQRKYGSARAVSAVCAASILQLQLFRDGDFLALKKFSANLHSVVAALRLGGYGKELQSSATLSQLP